jgi:sugar/nucleoside kinase (ribokinase family)
VRAAGGGSAANTACWLASTGCPTALVAMVGDDAMAPGALAALEAASVTFLGGVAAGAATGTCVVLVDPDGERTMLPDRGANDRLDPGLALDALDARRPAWLHLSGYTLLDEGSRPAGVAALERASALGVPVSVDASSAGPLRHVGGATFLEWIDGIRLLFANDDEVAALGGLGACRRHVEVVVAKHGARGASWVADDTTVAVPAEPTRVVDTVGAGDALDAGVIGAVVAGAGPEAALRAGTRLAARAVARQGARPPHRAG